jgi:hypothetical protein
MDDAKESLREEWRPGSFTKNFRWGPHEQGMSRLHEGIRVGFDNVMKDVPRRVFWQRLETAGFIPHIPANFFLFNKIINETDFLVADELVFQALSYVHSKRFDKLALFAFNFSFAGRWGDAYPYQRRPAMWAFHYIADRVAEEMHWDSRQVSSADIETFLRNDKRYRGATTRKVATNLSYLYSAGRLGEFDEVAVDRWWVDALFLALDRIIEDSKLDSHSISDEQYQTALFDAGFGKVSGRASLEKRLAVPHLVHLYTMCGARDRFLDEEVRSQTLLKMPDFEWILANDGRPQGAVHPTNARILKSIPRACAMLARYAGFDVIDADELETFDLENFVRKRTRDAILALRNAKIGPAMSAEELMSITRGR